MSDERQNTNEATKDIMQAVTTNFPGYADAINSKTKDTALKQLAADQAVSPGYAELAQEISVFKDSAEIYIFAMNSFGTVLKTESAMRIAGL